MPLYRQHSGLATILLLEDTVGHIVPALVAANAATYSQSGTTLTVTSAGHNMTATHNGKNVYLANATISTGVAPTGYSGNWFSGFTYINANSFSCTCTNSQTATGTLLTNTSLTALPITGTLTAGAIGLNGQIEYEVVVSNNNSAGNKTLNVTVAGTAVTATVNSTNITGYVKKCLKLMNSLNRQVSTAQSSFGPTATSVAALIQTLDLTVDASIGIALTVAAASDFAAIETATIVGKKFI